MRSDDVAAARRRTATYIRAIPEGSRDRFLEDLARAEKEEATKIIRREMQHKGARKLTSDA
jgi:hypothetical protein